MKSIILSAQNVRDFLKDRTITIEKSAAAAPYEIGDVVFIREPWHRMKTANGDSSSRFNYASTATAKPTEYRWASPVSMPADAIRYYARIVHVVEKAEAHGDDVAPSQEITLEFISKIEAEAAETGLPLSSAADSKDAGDQAEPKDEEKAVLTEETLNTIVERKKEIESILNEIDIRLETIADIERSPEQFTTEALEEIVAEREELSEKAGLLKQELSEIERRITGKPEVVYAFGTCRFCGQVSAVDGDWNTQEAADDAAINTCDCPKARSERSAIEQINDAKVRIQQLFGPDATEYSFAPVAEPEPITLLDNLVELVARRHISSAAVQIRGYCKAKISLTKKGKIKIERSEARSYQLEAGE